MPNSLSPFEHKNAEVVVPIRMTDAGGHVFFGGLSIDEGALAHSAARDDCPKDKQSVEYYFFLLDKGGAIPCSPDEVSPPLSERDPNGALLTARLYTVTAQGLCYREATQEELSITQRHACTHFLWRMKKSVDQRLLNGPKAEPT